MEKFGDKNYKDKLHFLPRKFQNVAILKQMAKVIPCLEKYALLTP